MQAKDAAEVTTSKAELRRKRRELQVSSNAAKNNTPAKQKGQKSGQQKQAVQPSEGPPVTGASTALDGQEPPSAVATAAAAAAATKSKIPGHALGVMRMDDPAHLKKSIKQLHRKNLQPRPQEPVRVNLFSHLSQPDKRVDVLGELRYVVYHKSLHVVLCVACEAIPCLPLVGFTSF
ncbi:unnamed protein product [Dibothriocephalus latus]|uniref:Uncharacterized protein n=1 Tax=Dibothriocephalus latus TaxID=60516 RepID=A0A3P7L913_DIBLA|nr:unnamed protein product [Dibothriocephalus latus]